jgi:protein-tyrosine phosphatase
VSYERAVDPQTASTSGLYGFTVNQRSAYDSRTLLRTGLAIAARQDATTLRAGANAITADRGSAGFDARLSLDIQF